MPKLPELYTMPSAVDPHTHLREPSPINKAENFASGTEAAVYGGYAALGEVSNTQGHPTSNFERLMEKITIARNTANIPLGFWMSSQPDDNNIGEIQNMRHRILGAKFFSHPSTGNDQYLGPEDLRPFAQEFHRLAPDLPIALHAGPHNLEGFIELAEEIGFHLYIFHMNNPDDVDLATKAKQRGVKLTREVSPHHLLMTDEDVKRMGWGARMQPPLRPLADTERLMHQVRERQVDTVGTDHAPHSKADKAAAQTHNPKGEPVHEYKSFGVRSIAVAPQVLLYEFLRQGISIDRFIGLTSTGPANAVGATISYNTNVVRDMAEFEVTPEDDIKLDEAAPTPFIGRMAVGRVIYSQIKGRTNFENGRIVRRHHQLLTKGVII